MRILLRGGQSLLDFNYTVRLIITMACPLICSIFEVIRNVSMRHSTASAININVRASGKRKRTSSSDFSTVDVLLQC